jgi:hypothetical protein
MEHITTEQALEYFDSIVAVPNSSRQMERAEIAAKAIRAGIAWSSLIHEASERPEPKGKLLEIIDDENDRRIQRWIAGPETLKQWDSHTSLWGIKFWLYESDFIDFITKQREVLTTGETNG